MNKEEILEALLDTYGAYYNIKREDATKPFDAEAFLSNEAEQYFLVKAAKVASVNSYEYAYFALRQELSFSDLSELDSIAWEEGLKNVNANIDHKNTDIALLVICDKINDDVKESINNLKHSKNYKFGLWGFSNYRLVAIEAPSYTVLTNRRGRELKDFVQQIINKKGEKK